MKTIHIQQSFFFQSGNNPANFFQFFPILNLNHGTQGKIIIKRKGDTSLNYYFYPSSYPD
jgi:hypothetical protein